MHRATFFLVVLCIIIQVFLFRVKYDVVQLEKEHKATIDQITKTQELLHVAKAEWAHLNELSRLESLAKKYLTSIGPITGDQMISLKNIPDFLMKEEPIIENKPESINLEPQLSSHSLTILPEKLIEKTKQESASTHQKESPGTGYSTGSIVPKNDEERQNQEGFPQKSERSPVGAGNIDDLLGQYIEGEEPSKKKKKEESVHRHQTDIRRPRLKKIEEKKQALKRPKNKKTVDDLLNSFG